MEMTLLLISFIFHGISFIVIFLLYQKLKSATEAESQFEKRISEVEDLFNSYLLELKDENKKFLGLLTHLDHLHQDEADDTDRATYKEKQAKVREHVNVQSDEIKTDEESFQYERQALLRKAEKPVENNSLEKVQVKDKIDTPSIESQIMHLYSSGASIEEIAKKFNRGNTEVELIVKFNSLNERINT